MRLTAITVSGFLKISKLEISPLHDINLIAGFNESGKTSLAEAIGFALRGLPERVKLKKNYGDLVNSAYDEARITLDRADNESVVLNIKRKTGRVTGGVKPENVSHAMHCALDMHHFIEMDDKQRRQMLFKLAGVGASVKEVKALLEQAGCNMDKVALIEDYLKAGFDTAASEAKNKVSDCNRDWARLTGEKHGTDKAKTWQPEYPAKPDNYDEAESLREQRDQLTQTIKDKQQQRDEKRGALKYAEKINEQMRSTKQPQMTREEFQQQLDDANKEYHDAANKAAELEELLRRMTTGEHDKYHCPECSAELMWAGGQLHKYQKAEYTDEDKQAAQDDLAAEHKRVTDAQQLIHRAREAIAEIDNAEQLQQQAKEAGDTQTLQHEIEGLDGQIQEHERQRDALADKIIVIDKYEQEYQRAADLEAKAKSINDASEEWQFIREQLEPEGIPKTLMGKALDPLNVTLQEFSQAAGWPQVCLDEGMLITYGEYAYGLCSESAQWRCAAILAAAISHLSNINFLLLDRVDVLDMKGRSQMLDLADYLKGKGMQTIMCATLKQPVNFEGINCVWLGDKPAK